MIASNFVFYIDTREIFDLTMVRGLPFLHLACPQRSPDAKTFGGKQ
jgi:hypothetical protein